MRGGRLEKAAAYVISALLLAFFTLLLCYGIAWCASGISGLLF